ncbi:MAG: hypothetical protein QXG00_05230 [Candidatus Woesearchaeota archaeon]
MEHIFHGCPICHNDVNGTERHKYYCRNCRILFNKNDLFISKKYVKFLVKKHIIKKVDRSALKRVYARENKE